MPGNSITSANTTLMLSQPLLFPTPQQIQQFATDDIFDIEEIRSVEVSMGVDGVLSGGFVFAEIPFSIALQANSPSNAFFDIWWTQMVAAQDVYSINGTIKLPGISTKFNMTNGFLTGYKPAPGARKTLQPRRYRITFNNIAPVPN